ncbi:MAG: DsbA family oxidoreductase [Agriterribacter sp.]
MSNNTVKMKVEIWSDIMCPFCYIGKRKFESALKLFDHAGCIETEWHSFQLDPDLISGDDKNLYGYLSERKGISYQQSVEMHKHVTDMAAEVELKYNFDKAVIANSFDAHRLIQLAKTRGLGDAAEERLFRAYFTEGKDVGNHAVLKKLGNDIGLKDTEVDEMLASNAYTENVQHDIHEAAQIGVRGVPFFVFNRKFAVSGAQPPEVFLQALQQAYEGWRKNQPAALTETGTGAACTPGGDCG